MHNHLIPAVIVLLLCCAAAYATQEGDSDLSMQVPDVYLLDVEPGSIDFQPDLGNVLEGWTEAKEVTAIVSANADWVLMIKGNQEFWEGPYQKPVSDIYWNLAGGDFQPLSTQSVLVVSGGLSDAVGYPIHIKVKLDITKDIPGNYHFYYVVIELMAP
jgi:hypothetical protein